MKPNSTQLQLQLTSNIRDRPIFICERALLIVAYGGRAHRSLPATAGGGSRLTAVLRRWRVRASASEADVDGFGANLRNKQRVNNAYPCFPTPRVVLPAHHRLCLSLGRSALVLDVDGHIAGDPSDKSNNGGQVCTISPDTRKVLEPEDMGEETRRDKGSGRVEQESRRVWIEMVCLRIPGVASSLVEAELGVQLLYLPARQRGEEKAHGSFYHAAQGLSQTLPVFEKFAANWLQTGCTYLARVRGRGKDETTSGLRLQLMLRVSCSRRNAKRVYQERAPSSKVEEVVGVCSQPRPNNGIRIEARTLNANQHNTAVWRYAPTTVRGDGRTRALTGSASDQAPLTNK
ncbi:hypothetical protein C8R46DRAFT_1027761 [Mycena filopes]|nr:hypothetical protein C8R46DRAFT_1027761 [Mycena filopes]